MEALRSKNRAKARPRQARRPAHPHFLAALKPRAWFAKPGDRNSLQATRAQACRALQTTHCLARAAQPAPREPARPSQAAPRSKRSADQRFLREPSMPKPGASRTTRPRLRRAQPRRRARRGGQKESRWRIAAAEPTACRESREFSCHLLLLAVHPAARWSAQIALTSAEPAQSFQPGPPERGKPGRMARV